MRRTTTGLIAALALALVAACGGGPTEPDPDPPPADPGPSFSTLIVSVPDSTTFVGDTIPVEMRAVLESGDTVTAPDSAELEVPSGFEKVGDRRVLAVDEAAGEIVGRLNPTDSTQVRSAVPLDDHVPWRAEWTCYDHDNMMRDGERVGVDSIRTRARDGGFRYNTPEEFEGQFIGDLRSVRWWKDGVVDTAFADDNGFLGHVRQAFVDTLETGRGMIPATDSSTSERPSYEIKGSNMCKVGGGEFDSATATVLRPGR